jgi:tetratricopeptide (TPR) repeat protein
MSSTSGNPVIQSLIDQQLKSQNPKERYQAIKQIARTKDSAMLPVLAKIAQDDPDEQVRKVAAKAHHYIESDGGLPPAEEAKSVRSVNPTDEARAMEYTNEALGYQMKGERNKALKALGKAVKLNPNIRTDNFFVSVLDATTGLSGEESYAMLHNESELKNIQVTEKQLKKEKRAQEHHEIVSKATWATAVLDIAIYTCILIAGTVLVILVLGQSADGVITGYQASVQAYRDAVASGVRDAVPPEPVDPEFWGQAQALRVISFPTAMIAGLVAGIASLVSLVVQLSFTHLAARYLFRGDGTFRFLVYKVVSTYNSNLPVVFAIMILGIILAYSSGSNTIGAIFSAILGLYSLKLTFQTLGKVGETYDFGMAKGCMSVIAGGIIVGIISFVVQMLFLASLTQLIQNSMV